jgi:hypothetical protein
MKTQDMKKLLLSLAIILAIYPKAFSQVEFGFVYFPSITNISNADTSQTPYLKNKLTFAGGAGVTLSLPLNKQVSFSTGLLYASHNQKFDAYAPGDPSLLIYSGKKRLDYLKLPLMLKYRSGLGKTMFFTVYGGPQLCYLLKGDGATVVYQHYPGNSTYYFDLPAASNSYYTKFIVEATIGAGFDYVLSSNWLLNLGMKLDYGINNTESKKGFDKNFYDTHSDHTNNQQGTTRNFSMNLMMGVSYRLTSVSLVHPHQGRHNFKTKTH